MSFIYTRAQLKSRINAGIQGRIDMLISADDTVNDAVREVVSDCDLRSARRETSLSPKLFSSVYEYACPSDLSASKIIDIPPQAKRADDFFLVNPREFSVKKELGSIAIDDKNGIRTLLISADIDDKSQVLSTMDSLTSGGGTWALFGDATGLAADNDDFVEGSGSISWNISAAGGTTAGIQNSGLTPFDLDDNYLGGNGAVFVWAYIVSTTGLTNYILRIGSSTSNYYSKTITTRHDGTAFVAGWNLLRFDLTSLSQTGTPNNNAASFVAIYMTKTTGKVSETDNRFDHLVIRKGEIHNVKYYSKYGWQTAAGAYIENSTDDGDFIVCDTDEYRLFIDKGVEIAAKEINEDDKSTTALQNYARKVKAYRMDNPSEAKIMTNEYYAY